MRSGLGAGGEVLRAERTTVVNATDDLAAAGLERPNGTEYTALSADGYAWADKPPRIHVPGTVCVLDLDECLAPLNGTTSTLATFKRFAYERRDCGDCLMSSLVARSGPRGLAAFLPTTEPEDVRSVRWAPRAWPKDWQAADLALAFPDPQTTTRAQIASLLLRYSYVVGESPTCVDWYDLFLGLAIALGVSSLSLPRDWLTLHSSLITMVSPAAFKPNLDRVDADEHQVFVTLNDDNRSERLVKQFDATLGRWLEKRFPDPAPWETGSSNPFSPE